MPTFNSPLYAGQVGTAGGSPQAQSGFPSAQMVEGKLRYAVIQHLLSTEATADLINLVRLPIGAKVLPSLSYLDCEDPGTALTLDIGDVTDPDRYLDGAALTTAHSLLFPALASTTAVAAQRLPFAITAGNELIIATCVLVTVPTVGAKVTIYLAYLAP